MEKKALTLEMQRLTSKQYAKVSSFIYSNYGIKLPDHKKIMVEGRLNKRLKATGCTNFEVYLDKIFGSTTDQAELIHMVDAITTNKTDFFREPHHFNYMNGNIEDMQSNGNVKIWSAACSTGEEPYTLSIVLEELKRLKRLSSYEIKGSDLSTEVLQKAANGIYKEELISMIPIEVRKRYFLKGKNEKSNMVRLIPPIRNAIKYRRINFIDESYAMDKDFDVIFCRNVLIYFDRETQEAVINKLCRHLKPNGYFFLGHSESISGKDVPLKQIEPTIYKKIS